VNALRSVTAARLCRCYPRGRGFQRSRIKENAEVQTLEQGKTLVESETQSERRVETFDWHGCVAERLNAATILPTSRGKPNIVPGPTGVAAAFTPGTIPRYHCPKTLCSSYCGLPRDSQGCGRDARDRPGNREHTFRCRRAAERPSDPIRQRLLCAARFDGCSSHVFYGIDSGRKGACADGDAASD
jgi:hypothetical protein